jgi:hypothetical protein
LIETAELNDVDPQAWRSTCVRSPFTAASATFALNAALCFFRIRFMSCSCAASAF